MSNDSSSSNSSSFNNGEGQANVSTTLQQQNQGIDAGVWHQSLELFFICFCCFFTIVLIIARTWVRRRNSKKFSADDYWILFAAFLTVPYWVCQVGTNRFGSGLHIEVVSDSDGKDFLGFERGWAAYYFITSMIKVSELLLILGIMPSRFRKARIFTYVLCGCIMALGLALSLAWFFQCLPVASNFDWTVTANTCINFGPPRYAWVALGICFDAFIIAIPIVLLRTMMMKSHERTVLMLLFGSNVFATSILIAGLAGIYFTGDPAVFVDYTWLETIYIIMQNLEMLAYTVGASAPVLYRSIVGKSGSRGSSDRSRSWKLRHWKDSGESGGTTLTNNTAKSAPRTGRKGSIFKPAHMFPSTAQDVRHGEFIVAEPTAPHLYNDNTQLNSDYKHFGGES